MFTEQLTIFPVRSKSPDFKIAKQNSHSRSQDLHFQICTAFLKKTGQKLLLKQAEIINESAQILNSFQLTFKNLKREAHYISTDDSSQTPEDEYSYDSQQKVITRKNITRRSQNTIQQALKQIKQLCSPSTYGALSNAASELTKLQGRMHNIEAKQHVINKKQEAADKFHQQNLMQLFIIINRLKTKLQAEQTKSNKLQQEINSLKSRNQNFSKCVEQKVNAIAMNQKIIDINQKVYRDIKAFLQDKQMHINSRLRKIQHIEESIMIKIQTILHQQALNTSVLLNVDGLLEPAANVSQSLSASSDSTCQRCCSMLKKLKQSILQYRDYLEHEAQQVERLYSKHKKALFTFSSKGGGSNKSLG